MLRSTNFLLCLALAFASSALAQSRIDCSALNSRILNRSVRYCVYLPSGYDAGAKSPRAALSCSLFPARPRRQRADAVQQWWLDSA